MAPYFVQDLLSKTVPHHTSISALWENKWRPLAARAIYPFVDGKVEDFDPIFASLAKLDNFDDPYDPDRYAAPFMPVAEDLAKQAVIAEKAGDTNAASALYL